MKKCLFLIVLSCFFTINFSAQHKGKEQKYRKAQEKLELEIQFLNEEISRMTKNQKNLNEKAIVINKQLRLYEEYLSTVNKDILVISEQIQEKNNLIFQMEQNIEMARLKLKTLIRIVYLLRSPVARLAFLFGSASMQTTYNKYVYINQVRQKITRHIQQLKQKLGIFQKEKEELLALQDEKINTQKKLLSSIQKYQILLLEQSKLRVEAKRREKELRRQLENKKKEMEKLNQKIQNLIASSTNTKTAGSRKTVTSSGQRASPTTKEDKASSSAFLNQKGRLSWPVEGTVIGYFGEQTHPLLEDIKYKNNGIDIICRSNSSIRSVFDGIVTQVLPIDNDNYLVIIRHDDYLTVYTQLTEVMVPAGMVVSKDTPIGKITKKENSVLHFEIWHEKTPLNPLDWLKK